MAATPEGFRTAFPVFSDKGNYTDGRVSFWLSFASKVMDVQRWGELLDHGAYLLVAHNLAIEARSSKDAAFGKAPGQATGIVTNKSVDKVSIGYDASSVAEEGAGAYNLTVYGQQFIRLARLIGAGPVQVDAPITGQSTSLYSGLPYLGPY